MVDYLSLISKHTRGEHEQTVPAFIIHSALVTKKALDIARDYLERNPAADIDLRLLEEMGMLHDIGVFSTDTPQLFTQGEGPYITHLSEGAHLLEQEGLPLHASAARTHSDITRAEIVDGDLPLPAEDHVPSSPEEEVLSVADKFYAKRFDSLFDERSLAEVREYLRGYGEDSLARFDVLYAKYCE